MKQFVAFVLIVLSIASCKKEDALDVVLPGEYFPAYPGSQWFYSNGERSWVHTSYMPHSYETGETTERTTEKLVPYIDGEYLYKYEITQKSITMPVKKLLDESVVTAWLVNDGDGREVYRKTTEKTDTLVIKVPDDGSITDTFYTDIVVVVEYTAVNGINGWHNKEYYAKNVGLVQVEVNNPNDTLGAIIEKQLIDYKINN
ncbi:MAG: hypothetical protein PF517_20060 [Salinivirgaceae bacterium]|jgi:hypothetical protein|nr:hypothetical protein [Salinivirgaceae bacterium]